MISAWTSATIPQITAATMPTRIRNAAQTNAIPPLVRGGEDEDEEEEAAAPAPDSGFSAAVPVVPAVPVALFVLAVPVVPAVPVPLFVLAVPVAPGVFAVP
ncbi:hypothetical protein EF906_15420 [Streptomyces sp. WAC08241]|nr:hypothetical protein EF906_15420 [Streptomyces sp. WAC08241]